MPKYRSPFTEEIYIEWDQLVLAKGMKLSDDERRRRWRALHKKCWDGSGWTVGVMDAALVASLGSTIHLQMKRWKDARNLGRQFLAHPLLDKDGRDHEVELVDAFAREGLADLLAGNVRKAVERLMEPLRDRRFAPMHYEYVLRGLMNWVLMEFAPEAEPEPDVRTLTAELIARFRGCKRLSRRAAKAESYAELGELLDATYKPRSRPQSAF